MDAQRFSQLADDKLAEIENWLHQYSDRYDTDQQGDGVLQIEDDQGRCWIINRHAAAQEIWLAAPSGAHHFRYDACGDWIDTRDGLTLFDRLKVALSIAD